MDGLTSGSCNVALGKNAHDDLSTGNFNNALGYAAGASVSTGCNTLNLGKNANKTSTNQGCINGEVYLNVNDTSDCRAKRCITDSDLGLAFINAVRPVKYKYKVPRDLQKDGDGNIIVGSRDYEGDSKSKQFEYGLIAQELETVLSDLNFEYADFAGVNDREVDLGKTAGTKAEMEADPDNVFWPGEHDYDPGHASGIYQKTKSVKYIQFIAPMIKASQELDDKIIALTARVADLE